ncbi:hypothetical protein Agub_g7809, partial [Astrephomene gubernaculifera]
QPQPQQQQQPQQLAKKNYEDCLTLARSQQYDEAAQAFEDFLQREPGHDKAWISYAQMSKKRYMQHGAPSLAYEACGSVLDRGLALNPQAAKIWQSRGLLELQQGHTGPAKELLKKAVALDARLAPVLNWKAVREGGESQPVVSCE